MENPHGMIFPVKADLVGLLGGLVSSLRPFANAHKVQLRWLPDFDEWTGSYQPEQILPAVTQLICRIVTFTPNHQIVRVRLSRCHDRPDCLLILVQNEGIDLSLMGDITADLPYEVTAKPIADQGSQFSLYVPINLNGEQKTDESPRGNHDIIQPWYSEIRKRLTSHFKSAEHLQELAAGKNSNDGDFLKKINDRITANMEQEGFNSKVLAKKMSISRSQLYRKVKALTQMSPGRYIRFFRLNSAKRLLEQGDLNVTEVAYRVGFMSCSHFSRSFQQQFGFNPSAIRWSADNESLPIDQMTKSLRASKE